jgi:methyl-accepting chemotaxis protein
MSSSKPSPSGFRSHPRNWNVGTKITAFTFALVAILLGVLIIAMGRTTGSILEQRAEVSAKAELSGVLNMIEMFNHSAASEASRSMQGLTAAFAPDFTLDPAELVDVGGKQVPVLKNAGKPVNGDFSIPDRFLQQNGGPATVFVASGEDFVRISTSLKKENGERAVGTVLDHASPAYASLREGKPYVGLASLFGKQFLTRYEPIRDSAGKPVGALFIGVDISADMLSLKTKIKAIKVGETGYFFVLDATPGKQLGDLVVHPAKEGSNILESKDSDGRAFIKEMMEKKNGLITYPWLNAEKGETRARNKTVVYGSYAAWNWLVAGGTYQDEITREAGQVRNMYVAAGFAALLLFAVMLYLMVRATVTRPLVAARDAAMLIADGDLTATVDSAGRDEIGRLLRAMGGISRNLSSVVGKVREGADQISTASGEISSGNLDLCTRTEQQAANLATTASSMDQLTQTVRQNADNARQGSQMALNASQVAQQGGQMVSQVVETMGSINQSSRKIVDIIGTIDGIAFQTNILALNAAVEAARAGEQGRGFAVVASEVRNLAQRSAAAAKEIKALIAASVEQVDLGTKMVESAGQTMNDVLASVGRVTDIMSEISAASAEQSDGIEHVNRSIGEMDRATQENAALVEQASAAALAMHDQAATLVTSVQLFKLARQRAVPGAAPVMQARLALTGA